MNIGKSWKTRAALALMSATSLAYAGDAKPEKVSPAPKPGTAIKRKVSPVDPKELDTVIKDISKMRSYLGTVQNSLEFEDQNSLDYRLIKESTKLTQADKKFLSIALKKIEEENKLETAKAKEQKKDPVAVFLITPQVIKDLEIVQSKMKCLRDRGVITEEQIPQLKDALGFSKLSSEESSVPAFGVMLKQRRYSFFFAEGSKLDAWIKRSENPEELEAVKKEIEAKIKAGHTPVKKIKIHPNGIDFPGPPLLVV